MYENIKTKNKPEKINAVTTANLLAGIIRGTTDLSHLDKFKIDKFEAAVTIQHLAKIIREISVAADLPSIQLLVEQIYYETFDRSILRECEDFQVFMKFSTNEKLAS